VSYDIYFVRRDPGQSFEDALDEVEDSFEGDPGPLTTAELEQWDDVLRVAREVLTDVEEFGDETTRELTHPSTGIQVSLFNGEVAIRVPYGDFGDESIDVMAKVYTLARGIEKATGLEGYDPQLEEPVSDVTGSVAGAPWRPTSRRADEDDDESAPVAAPPPPRLDDRELEPAMARGSADRGERRWWEFWKR
jgi:hypothetical protein